jgi:tryptophan-rich sensory protein
VPILEAWLLGILFVGALTAASIGGLLLVRRRASLEILEQHNEIAGFIYAIVGVLYAVLLGFSAIIVWEQYVDAQSRVEQEANQVADLYRDARALPPDLRKQIETQLRAYARTVVEKEWPAMAERRASLEAWEAYNRLWRTYQGFKPRDAYENAWYQESLRQLNELGDHRRLRLLSNRSEVPGVIWVALLGGGAVTIAFSYLFGAKHTWAQAVMIAGLGIMIALVLLSIFALQHPFSGLSRIAPHAFHQTIEIIDQWSHPRTGEGR